MEIKVISGYIEKKEEKKQIAHKGRVSDYSTQIGYDGTMNILVG